MKMIYLSLLVVGILLVILGVAVIVLYPIRLEVHHRSVFILIYNFKYKPPVTIQITWISIYYIKELNHSLFIVDH